MQKPMRLLAGVAAGVTLLACGQRSEPTPEQAADVANFVRPASDAPSAASSGAQSGSAQARPSKIDPCTFFTKAELESAVGYPLRRFWRKSSLNIRKKLARPSSRVR